MKLSDFGQHLTRDSGIVRLMEDLGDALNVNPDILFLGGGNPARIPEFEEVISRELVDIARNTDSLNKLIGVYQSPQGSEEFIRALAKFYQTEMGWDVGERNIAIANGSQSAFFVLLNLLAGNSSDIQRKLCFPLMPEYLGYADQCISAGAVYGFRPAIELLGSRQFKYHVDFGGLNLQPGTAALCVSRPTNPTGNVLAASELEQLSAVAKSAGIPLILDCAYGDPFPGVCYEQVETIWHDNTVLVQSLSKLGLPGARTGIVVASEALISRFVKANTIMSLANGNLGPAIATSLLSKGHLTSVREQVIKPFYRSQRDFMLACIESKLQGVNYRVHVAQGAFFVWIWLPELSISSQELYLRCKAKGLLIMPGEPFFFGLDEEWDHSSQCIRLTYCQSEKVISAAIDILAQELMQVS